MIRRYVYSLLIVAVITFNVCYYSYFFNYEVKQFKYIILLDLSDLYTKEDYDLIKEIISALEETAEGDDISVITTGNKTNEKEDDINAIYQFIKNNSNNIKKQTESDLKGAVQKAIDIAKNNPFENYKVLLLSSGINYTKFSSNSVLEGKLKRKDKKSKTINNQTDDFIKFTNTEFQKLDNALLFFWKLLNVEEGYERISRRTFIELHTAISEEISSNNLGQVDKFLYGLVDYSNNFLFYAIRIQFVSLVLITIVSFGLIVFAFGKSSKRLNGNKELNDMKYSQVFIDEGGNLSKESLESILSWKNDYTQSKGSYIICTINKKRYYFNIKTGKPIGVEPPSSTYAKFEHTLIIVPNEHFMHLQNSKLRYVSCSLVKPGKEYAVCFADNMELTVISDKKIDDSSILFLIKREDKLPSLITQLSNKISIRLTHTAKQVGVMHIINMNTSYTIYYMQKVIGRMRFHEDNINIFDMNHSIKDESIIFNDHKSDLVEHIIKKVT